MTSSYEAESLARVEEARRTGAGKLYLSDLSLSVLPESLGQLTNLETLELSGNGLSVLPESLGQLTNLEELNLSGNGLSVLPESDRKSVV